MVVAGGLLGLTLLPGILMPATFVPAVFFILAV
jgi:hypothetical protein